MSQMDCTTDIDSIGFSYMTLSKRGLRDALAVRRMLTIIVLSVDMTSTTSCILSIPWRTLQDGSKRRQRLDLRDGGLATGVHLDVHMFWILG